MPSTFDKYKTFYYFKKENETIPIVFIHGVGLTKEMWSPQINFFKDQNILTYDLIGHGKTSLEKTQLNFEDFIKQLLNLIDELELKKIHLVGFSLGSLIARHFASEHSNKLSSLVLHASIYKRSIEQKRVVENRFWLMKLGKPASEKSSASITEHEGSFSEGFNIKAFPQAIEMGYIHIGTIAGKLKGVIPAQMPKGCLTDQESILVPTF